MAFSIIRVIMRPITVLSAFSVLIIASAGIANATDAAQVAGDLQVEGLWFSGDTNKTVIRKPTDFPAPWTISGTDIYYSRGNVGIGTLSPTTLLDVNGIAKATAFVGPSLGTTDSTPFEIMVNNSRVLRIEPNAESPNIAAGYSGNVTGGTGVSGATVSGGGNSLYINTASGYFSTAGGGDGNTASGGTSTVSGGGGNTANGGGSTVSGGYVNTANGGGSTVSGGYVNTANGEYSTVGGGKENTVTVSGWNSTVGGGTQNMASGNHSTVGGGQDNIVSGVFSTVGGGLYNTASGKSSTVVGGSSNQAGGDFSFAGGLAAKVRDAATAGNTTGDQGTFLWADSSLVTFDSITSNEFAVRATGGFRFVTAVNGTTGAPTKTTSIDSNGKLSTNSVDATSINALSLTVDSIIGQAGGAVDITPNLTVLSGPVTSGSFYSGTGMMVGGSGSDRYMAVKRDGSVSNPLSVSKAAAGYMVGFYVNGSNVGEISSTASTTTYGTTSDHRLKYDIRPTAFSVDDLMRLQVRDYTFKTDATNTPQTGFIAQELHEIIPQVVAVGGADPAVDPWQVDYGKLTPFLVKAVQDLKAENETLKAELAEIKRMLGTLNVKH